MRQISAKLWPWMSKYIHRQGPNYHLTRPLSTKQEAPSSVPYQRYEGTREEKVLPSRVDAVVVGGGVMGCSTLYHLAEQGMTNVILLEKDALTAGTTWHTAGLIWSLRANDTSLHLTERSKYLMKNLESMTGVNTGWINNGGLWPACSKDRLDEFLRFHSLGKAFGIESQVLSPAETKGMYPHMRTEDIYGSVYSPEDGTIDPAGYCTALTRAATSMGAQVFEGYKVEDIDVEVDDYGTKRVTGVKTNKGHIKTNCVVNCGGGWGRVVGAMASVQVPLIAMRHAYVVTEKIDGIQNMPNTRDHEASVYFKLQGDALCVGGYEKNPIFIGDIPKEFAFSLYELDWDVFGANMEGAMHRIPVLENTGIKSTVCGPESFTPDHNPLLGESPEVRGFYLGCAMNSGGMLFSGTCQELAKWIIQGKPDLDMYSFDIRRFSTKMSCNQDWIRQVSHETYAKYYDIVYPIDEPLACRNLRKDPLHQVLLDAGCVYQERQGWERPGWFSPEGPAPIPEYDYYGEYGYKKNENNTYAERLRNDYSFGFPKHHDIIGDECLSCRQNVAIFNMSYFGQFYLMGPDAQKAADWIFSNDMTKPPENVVYTCMLNHKGLVEGDLTVSILEPGGTGEPHNPNVQGRGFYIAAGGGSAQYTWSYIKDILQDHKWNCTLTDHSEDMCLLSVQGPHSRSVLQSLTDADLGDDCFPFGTHKLLKVAGHDVRALRLSFVGELGWELHVPNDSAVSVYKAVMEAGKQHGIVNAGYRAMDSLSLEKGYRHWHSDVRRDDTPLEGGLGFTCKLKSDTPFLGREAIEKQRLEGLKKRLVCFTLNDKVALHGMEAIWRDDQVVGYIRRADYAFALDKNVAYGYITRPDGDLVTMDYLKSGSYEIEHLAKRFSANLHIKSPFDPKHKRVQGIYDDPLPVK